MKISPSVSENFWILFGGLTAIFLGVWLTSRGLETNMDIRFYDESYYLTQGLFHPISSWLADYSALYSLYYKGLALLDSDPIQLYYQNYRIWAFLFSGSIFILLWRFGVHPGFALIWALCGLSAQINYLLWPKAGHFAMLGVSLGLVVFKSIKDEKINALVWISGICACISWARPEFSLGAFVGLLILFSHLIFAKFQIQILRIWTSIPWFLAGVFAFVWGLPVGRSGRGNVAFGQHFVHNLGKIQGRSDEQMLLDWVNWRTVFKQYAGNPDAMIASFWSQPKPLFEHLFLNGKNLISNLFTYFSETLVPVHWLGIPVFFTLGICWILAESCHGFNGFSRLWNRNLKSLKPYFPTLIPLLIPSLVAGLIFQPRPHYILPLFPFFLILVALWLRELNFPQISSLSKSLGGGIVCLAILFFIPDSGAFFRLEKEGFSSKKEPKEARYFSILTQSGLKNVSRIQSIKDATLPFPCRMFDGSTGVTDFLGNRVVQKGKTGFEMDYKRLENFELFLQVEQINAIYLAPSLEKDQFFKRIAWLQVLKSRPESLGWRRVPLKHSEDQLFLKN